MGFNLGTERIQDTYQQLVQISGSVLLDGSGSVIPTISNISVVSSSYATTSSYAVSAGTSTSATTATSASHALYANQAGTATSATTATSASHALYANQAGTATSATTATSASHALYADQAGTATSATTASYISPTFISASAAASGFGSGGGTTPTLQQVTEVGNVTNLPITASAFSGNGSGLTNIPQVGQNAFFEADDYVFDLAGDTTSLYDIHISQSGTYFLSASSTPAGVQGPRVNLYYWPELIAVGGTARVKFFVPNGDTLTGIQYKENVTGSASNEYYWNSTTSPASTATRSITRNATFKQIAIGTGATTMTKDGNGRVFFVLSNANVNTTNYLYTGDSKNPLI